VLYDGAKPIVAISHDPHGSIGGLTLLSEKSTNGAGSQVPLDVTNARRAPSSPFRSSPPAVTGI